MQRKIHRQADHPFNQEMNLTLAQYHCEYCRPRLLCQDNNLYARDKVQIHMIIHPIIGRTVRQ